MKLKDLFDTTLKKLGIVSASVLGLVAFIYYDPFNLFEENEFKEENQNLRVNNNSNSINNKSETADNLGNVKINLDELKEFNFKNLEKFEPVLLKLAETIEKEKLEKGCLGYQSIYSIINYMFIFFKNAYKGIYEEGKRARLENLNDPKIYSDLFMKYEMEELEKTLGYVTEKFLRALNLDLAFYEQSFEKAVQANYMLAYLPIQKLQVIKQELIKETVSKINLTMDMVEEFYNYQIEITDNYDSSLFSTNPQISTQIKQQYVNDLAAKKFGFGLDDIVSNEEIVKSEKFKELNVNLLKKYGITEEMLRNQQMMM